ncbi:MAG: hypothetical protein KGL38_11350 [Gemmatimonadota bacterium]|nr:hypothetical protein [Gemmatimonadota bacterium]MDE3128594.1 hypothetical protein [Gemmatimonadota bacterium]MDE3172942.1 hypothetical protein [Gemmatimonadota bacterium]
MTITVSTPDTLGSKVGTAMSIAYPGAIPVATPVSESTANTDGALELQRHWVDTGTQGSWTSSEAVNCSTVPGLRVGCAGVIFTPPVTWAHVTSGATTRLDRQLNAAIPKPATSQIRRISLV